MADDFYAIERLPPNKRAIDKRLGHALPSPVHPSHHTIQGMCSSDRDNMK